MPVFGNRMVISTANYKHVQEVKKDNDRRELSLGKWAMEKQARKERLKDLQHRIRQGSVSSESHTQQYDLLTGDVDTPEHLRRASMSQLSDDANRRSSISTAETLIMMDRSKSMGNIGTEGISSEKLYQSDSARSLSPEHTHFSDTSHIVECKASDKSGSCSQCLVS